MNTVKLPSRILYLEGNLVPANGYAIANAIKLLDTVNNEDIILYVNTYGGDVLALLGIVDAMNEARSDIVTIVCGAAYSAGGFIAMSGTKGKRLISENSRFMLHMPRGVTESDDTAIRFVTNMKDTLNKLTAQASGKQLAEVEDLLRLELFLSAKDAVSEGFFDKIM